MKKIRPYISILFIILSAIAAFEFIPGVGATSWLVSVSSVFSNIVFWITALLLTGAGIALYSLSGVIKIDEFFRFTITRLCWWGGAALVGFGGYLLMANVAENSFFAGKISVIITYSIVVLFTIVTYIVATKKAANRVAAGAIRRSASSVGALKYSFRYLYATLIWIMLFGLVLVLFFKESAMPALYLAPAGVTALLLLIYFFVKIKFFSLLTLVTSLLQFFIILYNGLNISNIELLPYYSSVLFLSAACVLSVNDIYCKE